MLAVGTGQVLVVDSSWVTICCAFATPADAALVDEELAAGEVLAAVEPLLELLEPQAASTAVAVSTAHGASQRFHLFVITLCLRITRISTYARFTEPRPIWRRRGCAAFFMSGGESLGFAIRTGF